MLAFLGALALALVRHPIYGLYAYVTVFYVHPPSRWWGAFLPDLRWSLLAAAVTLLATMRLGSDKTRRPWYTTTPAKLLIAYTAWLWIQFGWTLNDAAQQEITILFTKYVVLFWLVYRLVDTPEQVRRFFIAHIAGCAYLGVVAFTTEVSGRLEGVGGPGIDEANTLAMQLATAISVGAMMILADRTWLRWVGIGAMALILNAIVLSGSRGAFLSMLCAGAVLAYFKPPQNKKLFYAFAVLGLAMFAALAPSEYWERMGTITAAVDDASQVDNSAESRLVLFGAQLRMTRQYPLGAGHRGTEVLSTQYLDEKYLANAPGVPAEARQRSSHNTFMTTLVEQGIPGAILFIWMWLWAAAVLLRLRRHAKSAHWDTGRTAIVAGLAGALTILLVSGMFVDYLKVEIQPWLFALLASLTATLVREQSGAQEPAPASSRLVLRSRARLGP